jgi:iron complex outermembrane receptor protein
MHRVQGVLNVPVTSWARARFGFDHQKRDGYLHNVSGIGPKNFADLDYYALRGSLVLDVAPNLENYTIVSYSKSDHVGNGPQIYRANPATSFGQRALPQIARLNANSDPYQIEQTLSNPRSLTKQWQIIDIATWQASENLTVKNIISYASFKQGLRQSVFGTNFQLVAAGVPSYQRGRHLR